MHNTDIKQIEDIIRDFTMDYSAYVLLGRCLADVRDGLKPVHRRILYSMRNAKNFTKSANVEGDVMKVHPHGSSYDTMVNMTQKDKQLIPYLEGKGNFSSHTSRDLQYGASRYTEVRLSQLSQDIIRALEYKTVNYIPSYDGKMMIPEVLPVNFPTILTHCNMGIGVGMSSNIPSFNLIELTKAMAKYIDEGEKTILVPDFSTGGYIIEDLNTFEKINTDGKGTIKLRAKANINKNIISITEIPYTTTREAIIDKIIELRKKGEFKEITGVNDLTGLKGMKIEITCKKNADVELVLEKLYNETPLQNTFSANMNMLVDGLPKVLGVWDTIDEWLKWRLQCIKIGLINDIDKLEKEIEILKGYGNIHLCLDDVIKVMRGCKSDKIVETLHIKFCLTMKQAEHIANMKFMNINEEYMQNKLKNLQSTIDLVDTKKRQLNDDKLLMRIISKQLINIGVKYGKERNTQIIQVNEKVKEKIKKVKEEVNNYPVRIICTKDGYVKKLSLNTKGDIKIKEGDTIVNEFITENKGELLIFANTDCYKVQISNIDDCKPGSLGVYIPTVIDCKDIIGFSVLDDKNKFILISYDNSKIAKVDLLSFKTSTQRKKLANSLNKDAKVQNILTFEEEQEFTIINSKQKETVKHTKDLSVKKARDTQGVNTIKNIIGIKK